MKPDEIVIEGTIRPDGTLVLDEPAKLPAGRVRVIVQSLPYRRRAIRSGI
jgi:hypothetical protein